MSGTSDSTDQIVSLESAVAHLQREVEQLNQVIVEQANLLQVLADKFAELETKVDSPEEDHSPFDPGLERPPHY